jgi:hypothetical protein
MSWSRRFPASGFLTRRLVLALALWCLGAPATADAEELPAEPVPGRLRVQIITGGHDFDEQAFFAMFDRMPGILWAHARYGGEAEKLLTPEAARRYDVLLFYDMNQRHGLHTEALEQLLRQGQPAVFLHHAIWAYPEWPGYARLVGGQANAGPLPKPDLPRSKFFHDVWMRVEIADRAHPITAGLRDFDIYDEAYQHIAISPDVHVLLRTDYPQSDRAIAWTHRYGRSRIVYLQPGHGPQSFSHPIFETLLWRSLQWSAGKLEEKPR